MKAVIKSKKILILILVLVVVAVAGLAVYMRFRSDNTSQEGRIVTSAFSVAQPDGITKNTTGKKNIYFDIARPYGELSVAISRSTIDYTSVVQRGNITESTVTVDGVSATRQAINYEKVVSGRSSKLLIRYEVKIGNIPKPSADDYTTFSVTALSKNDITASDIADVNATADTLLQSLIIK